jgi:hypothetical protein
LSRFEKLNRREAADTAILYAFDLIEHDGEDMGNRRFLDRKAALARLLHNTKAGILLNEHIVEDGRIVFAHAHRFGAEGIVSKKSNIDPVDVRSGSRSAIPPASPCGGTAARFGTDEPQAALARSGPVGQQTDGVEAMPRRKGEITRDDLKRKWPASYDATGRKGTGPEDSPVARRSI